MLTNLTRGDNNFHPTRNNNSEVLEAFYKAMNCNGDYVPWPLPNLKESTVDSFWGWRCSYSFKAETHLIQRKIDIDGVSSHVDIFVYWLDIGMMKNAGFAVAICRSNYQNYKIKYFTWAKCDHDWKGTKESRMCYHHFRCTKCLATYDYHSD